MARRAHEPARSSVPAAASARSRSSCQTSATSAARLICRIT
ncbi:hypothetical protein [Olsenella sp. An290]|nr:hypothetical protein [Olsenella sp. An290]